MKTREANVLRPIRKRRAVERGRKISNAMISLILSFVVTVAAQSERINQEGRILGPAPVVTTPTLFNTPQAAATLHSIADHVREKNETAVMALSSGSGYKLPRRGAKATLTILNGP
jgi:hypothetical protein